ncbi:MAG TPA: HlyD family efflux transporter periplasmic adaptor subunit [Dokdonella sp.]|uniref:HlyD family secretion protein n=1 Tax=Dokdonella sp. TaxID=2291710 RepID=UPI002B768D11|nr:HlyD family efflux transporter periplasmic adaptor subunit [Dokdonella sp.]HUD40881.1 HlyD family efflux transporter periplasmic adaptor subunit [Dokdonella sp.]
MAMLSSLKNRLLPVAFLAAVAVLAIWAWQRIGDDGPGAGFVSGNGRVEATEIDVATKLPGRIETIEVREGDFVAAGQPVATMQIDTLDAQRAEAEAGRRQAMHAAVAAEAQVTLREAEVAAAKAQVAQRGAELDAARRRLARSQTLAAEGAASTQELDDDRARVHGAEAVLAATRAQVAAAEAAVAAAKAQVVGAHASVDAAGATVARIEADLDDSVLKAPRAGRVQVRVAQPGEVLGSGGRVLGLLDLTDVYMTFFVPEAAAGRIALGSEARIVLDTAPDVVIPATVSFVASQAQFTPKTVETASERQKLMFRVRAQIAPALLERYIDQVKTGVPGVAWLRIDPQVPWPAALAVDPRLLAPAAD